MRYFFVFIFCLSVTLPLTWRIPKLYRDHFAKVYFFENGHKPFAYLLKFNRVYLTYCEEHLFDLLITFPGIRKPEMF